MEGLNLWFIIALILMLGYTVYHLAYWAESDAVLRGRSPTLVKCAVILFFPWGLIAWLLFRPNPIVQDKQHPRPFDLNNFREQ